MIECRYCDRAFNKAPEEIGARCPKCRMPLFETAYKRRDREADLGRCDACEGHGDQPAVATCSRCKKLMCAGCRTRWDAEPVCAACVSAVLEFDEPTGTEEGQQRQKALSAFLWSVIAWLVLLGCAGTLIAGHWRTGTPFVISAALLPLLTLIPSSLGVGQAVASLRLRGRHGTLGLASLVASASHVATIVGIVFLNLWHN